MKTHALKINNVPTQRHSDADDDRFRQIRRFLHNRLIDSMEEADILSLREESTLRIRLHDLIDDLGSERGVNLSNEDRARLLREVMEEFTGLGPIAELMEAPGITDILINGPHEIWVEQDGALAKTALRFDDEAHLRRFLDRIVSGQGRQLDARQPMVDTRLADGSRVHAVIPPLCEKGPIVSIRRFNKQAVGPDELVESGFLSRAMLQFMEIAVAAGVNIVIAGSAGAGKTSLLNILAGYVPANERIVTVEETAELQLAHPHVIPLEARPVNSEGTGAVTLRDLVRTALRMRADRIIVGEVRGGEVLDMLQAMNVGHDGSLTTLHANTPRDVLNRLETLALLGDSGINRVSVRQMIASSVQLLIQVMRFKDGSRRVVSISELLHKGDEFEVVELFHFHNMGVDTNGCITGEHNANGRSSQLAETVTIKGHNIDQFNTALGLMGG